MVFHCIYATKAWLAHNVATYSARLPYSVGQSTVGWAQGQALK